MAVSNLYQSLKSDLGLVTQLKSWLSVNPVVGCPMGCKYCYRHDNDLFDLKSPIQTRSVEETLTEVLNHRFFVPGSTPLALHNMATDPFLNLPKKITFRILDELDCLGCSNSVGLITKYLVTKDDISFLESLSLDVNLFVTYSEMPECIEPAGNSLRRQTLRNLSDSSLKTLVYLRPVIEGFNTHDENIRRVLDCCGNVSAIVVCGLKVSDNLSRYFNDQGISIAGNAGHKTMPSDFIGRLLEARDAKGLSVPVFKRTSCAVSYLKSSRDYNAHWANPERNCSSGCPNRERCRDASVPAGSDVKFLMERLPSDNDFAINENFVGINGNLTEEETTFLRHNLLFPIKILNV
jgi:DNA repair photolyase